MDISWLISGLIILLLLGSAFFSSSETALFALDEMKLKKMKDKKARKNIREMLKRTSLLLVAILLGNATINTAVTALLEEHLGIKNVFLSTVAVTSILLLFGEIAPKTLALLRVEPVAVFNSRLLYPFFFITQPLTKAIDWITSRMLVFLNRFHHDSGDSMDKKELAALSSIVSREGIFDKEEKALIENVLNFASRELWNIMTPRTKVVSVDSKMPVKEIVKIFKKSKFSKIPVYQDTDDNLSGVIYLRDIFQYLHNPDKTTDKKASDLMEPMYFVPETKKLSEMLEDFRKKNLRIAAVVDEFGSALGLVTVADVLGEIVGELMDESFILENKVSVISSDRYLVRGDISLDDFNAFFETDLSSEEYETLAGFVIETAGDIPDEGYSLPAGGYKISIKERSDKHIEQFLVEKGV